MEYNNLTFEQALIDRLDIIAEMLERIANALENDEEDTDD